MVLQIEYQRQNTFLNKTTMTLLERIQSELDYQTNYAETRKRILFDDYAIDYYELSESMTDNEIEEFVRDIILDR